jgi:hypothetical protein
VKQVSLGLAVFAIAATAHAQIYTSRAVYDLAHPGNYVIDFNSATPAPPQYTDYTATTPWGPSTSMPFRAAITSSFSAKVIFPSSGANNLVLYAFNGVPLAESLLITMPANTFSFGLDLVSPSSTVTEPYQLKVYSGATLLQTLVSPSVNNGYTFIRYDSLISPITSVGIQISSAVGSFAPTIDNGTVVSKPATPALLVAGAIALLLGARWRSRT